MCHLQKTLRAVFDFDGTVARTFTKSPSGLGVHEAYELSVQAVLGDLALEILQEHGLKNRAPTELAYDLLEGAGRNAMLAYARRYLANNHAMLEGLVPQGKGVPLVWDDASPVHVIGELVTRAKLQVLLGEIRRHEGGTIWPEPCEGFLDFLRELKCRDIPIAIISSGHELFIKKTFALWGWVAPTMITDDDLRGLSLSVGEKSKPHRNLFCLLAKAWGFEERELLDSPRTVYFGDDLNKDGRLAVSAGVSFGWYKPEDDDNVVPVGHQFRFRNWRDLTHTFAIADAATN